MIEAIVGDLRAIAEQCSRLSRQVSVQRLSCALEELGIELMEKASTLEQSLDV